MSLCVAAYEQLTAAGEKVRVVSMPSWELFDQQPPEYRNQVLPPSVHARVSVEQASTFGWERFVGTGGAMIGMHTFGASAPLKDLQTEVRLHARRDRRHRPPAARAAPRRGGSMSTGAATANPLLELLGHGQSVWYDYIRRGLITSGELARLIAEDGLRGITSNPSIWEKAIAGSTDYADALEALRREGEADPKAVYEQLAIQDIRDAADAFRPVYEQTERRDGFVSIEVSPDLAHDTEGTIAEAERLWSAIARDNVMVKVPATQEGIPAIRELIGRGINVNITLLFAIPVYEQVVDAYMTGLESAGGERRRPGPHRIGGELLRQPDRHDRGHQARRGRRGLERRARAAAGQGRDRKREARLPELQGKRRRATAGGRSRRREPACSGCCGRARARRTPGTASSCTWRS